MNYLPIIGSRTVQAPNLRYSAYSQGTQSPPGRGGGHNCAYGGYAAMPEQGLRRYSGAQRDPSRPATPGPSYANVFEVSFSVSLWRRSKDSGWAEAPSYDEHIRRHERGIVYRDLDLVA